jgi:Cu-processing system ATP-binding protein
MIEARDVVKRYGAVEAVAGVSLALQPGELLGLIGHNGAGKSTLFRMMLGLEAPSAGEVRFDGRPLDAVTLRRMRRRLGYLPENVVLYDNLTGAETLAFFAALKGVPRAACGPALERVGLSHAADRRVRGYSKGMRQRLGFAQALLGAPTLLFLDEPTNGLDPQGIHDFYRILSELQAQGATIVLTSHILSEIQSRVGRVAILRDGRLQALGSVQALREATTLPLCFELRLTEGAEPALRHALGAVSPAELQVDGLQARVRFPRAAKMAVLRAVAALGAAVADLQLREPTLEELLLGHSA